MVIYAIYAIIRWKKDIEVYNPYNRVFRRELHCDCISFQEATGINKPFDEWVREASQEEFEEIMDMLQLEYNGVYCHADVLEIYPPEYMRQYYYRREGDIEEYYIIDKEPFDIVFSIVSCGCGGGVCEGRFRDSYKVNAGILREEDFKKVKREFTLMYLSDPYIVIDPRPADCVVECSAYAGLCT